jgi:hypothetical protein
MAASPIAQLRKAVRRAVLRGPILKRWYEVKSRRLENDYVRRIREEVKASEPAPFDSPLIRATRPVMALGTVLFMGDCLWEKNELFPEFRKICRLESLDFSSALQRAKGLTSAEVVAREVAAFAKAPHTWEPDVILFYARPSLLSDAVFDSIRRRWKCPLLGLNLDDRSQFFPYRIFASGDDDYARWVTKFDLNLTNAFTALDWYRQRGATVRYFPPGFHARDEFREPPARTDYEHTFSFLGSWKQERGLIVKRLVDAGVDIKLFGKGWPDGQWVDDPAHIFRRSQLNLGIGFALASARLTTTKARDVECPGVGACYVTTYNWELPQLFEVGKEILCYREFEELIEVHGFYAKRPAECLRIARAAHRRCSAEHTWEKRFRALFRDMGFRA